MFTKGSGFCYKCQKVHSTGPDLLKIDALAAGPSCKDLSMNNAVRKDFAGSYEGYVGTSATNISARGQESSLILIICANTGCPIGV